MIIYNAAQVLLNGWMVYRFVDAVVFRGHPFIGGSVDLVDTGATYAIWVHYCDKYLEFLDTYFMVLRGKMDQVRSLATAAPSF
jgi:elongation of very long chain fatty acids protein 4